MRKRIEYQSYLTNPEDQSIYAEINQAEPNASFKALKIRLPSAEVLFSPFLFLPCRLLT